MMIIGCQQQSKEVTKDNSATVETAVQDDAETIEKIREHFKWINEQDDFVVSVLNNEDFLDHAPDNGALLKGFYKNEFLYKIVEVIGLSSVILTTEYYFWDNQLIFVYDTEKHFKEIFDSFGNFIELDYSATDLKYESRRYFVTDKEIKRIDMGNRQMRLDTEKDFISNVKFLKPQLDNRKYYQDEYDKIQGMWTSTIDALNSIEFDGLTKVEYYDGEYIDLSKIKIEGKYLYFWTGDEKDEYKYEIMELTDNILKLLYLPAGRILTYEKLGMTE